MLIADGFGSDEMDDRLRQSLLYDFYGELLSDHQKAVYTAAVFDDMSYSELAEEFDCTRQAAFDLVRRTGRKLEGFEEKLGLLARFTEAGDRMKELSTEISSLRDMISEAYLDDKTRKKLDNKLKNIQKETTEIFETAI